MNHCTTGAQRNGVVDCQLEDGHEVPHLSLDHDEPEQYEGTLCAADGKPFELDTSKMS